jgi:hypothetical protein
MRTADGGDLTTDGTTPDEAYTLIATDRTFRVNADQSTTQIVNITAQSKLYGVQFTWTVLAATFDTDGPAAFIPLKTAEVNTICGHPHVQDFRSEVDQGASLVLYNYAVITVGTDDGAITNEVRQRMDQIGTPQVFAKIDAAWKNLAAAGAS